MFEFNTKMLTFDEYCIISEALNPKQTKFGNNAFDFDNNKYTRRLNTNTTWFLDGNVLYWVWFDSNSEIYFMKYTSSNLSGYLDTDWYVMDKTTPTNAIRIFSSIFYISLKMADDLNRDSIYFKGFSTALDKFYKFLGTNKQFLKSINELGWVYNGENLELKHEFKRK